MSVGNKEDSFPGPTAAVGTRYSEEPGRKIDSNYDSKEKEPSGLGIDDGSGGLRRSKRKVEKAGEHSGGLAHKSVRWNTGKNDDRDTIANRYRSTFASARGGGTHKLPLDSVEAVVPYDGPSHVHSQSSSLKSINSLSDMMDVKDNHQQGLQDLREVPTALMQEMRSREGSNDPDGVPTSTQRERKSDDDGQEPINSYNRLAQKPKAQGHPAAQINEQAQRQTRIPNTSDKIPTFHYKKTAGNNTNVSIRDSLKDSGTCLDVTLDHSKDGPSKLIQRRQSAMKTQESLKKLNSYYFEEQKRHMNVMSGLINDMATVAGDMMRKGEDPSLLNMSAAIRACTLANSIIYRLGAFPDVLPKAPLGDFAKSTIVPPIPGGGANRTSQPGDNHRPIERHAPPS